MRSWPARSAELYVEQREELGLSLAGTAQAGPGRRSRAAGGADAAAELAREPQTFLLEIGSEELPAADLASAIRPTRKRRCRRCWTSCVWPTSASTVQRHAAPPGRACPPAGAAADRPGNRGQRAAGGSGLRRGRQAHRRGPGFRPQSRPRRDRPAGRHRRRTRYVVADVFEDGRSAPAVLAERLPRWWPASASRSRCAGTRATSPTAAPCAGWSPSTVSTSCRFATPAWPATA